MAENIYADGFKGGLSVYDTVASAWKPIACLNQTSHKMAVETAQKVNFCTQGKTVTKAKSITETVDIQGEVIDTTSVGGSTASASLAELKDMARKQITDKLEPEFRLERDFDGFLYFKGTITNVEDTYSATEDATFSASLSINGEVTETDPHAGG